MNEPKIQPMIERLGFDAWADNLFVNTIEDFHVEGKGEISIENDSVTINMEWDFESINCVIRAYTKEGWKTYNKSIKTNESE